MASILTGPTVVFNNRVEVINSNKNVHPFTIKNDCDWWSSNEKMEQKKEEKKKKNKKKKKKKRGQKKWNEKKNQ